MDVGRQISDAVARLIESEIDQKTLRSAESGEWLDGLWGSIMELGLGDALVSADRGGHGLTWTDLAPVMQTIGAAALPLPVGEHMVARSILDEAGIAAPDGLITLATRPVPEQRLSDAGVTGEFRALIWAPAATAVVVECTSSSGSHAALISMDALTGEEVPSLSREPHHSATVKDVRPAAAGPVSQGALLLKGALLRSLQICGALNRVLEMCVEYVGVREQFGRPIGKFQAIQQLLAAMANEVAASNAITESTIRAVDGGGEADLAVMVAKARCSAAADRAASIAHEVHAAIGVTEEMELHHLTRRLWHWRDDFGSEHHWYDAIGARALASHRDDVWPLIIEGSGGAANGRPSA